VTGSKCTPPSPTMLFVGPSRVEDHRFRCTLHQCDVLTRWGVTELMTGNRGRALGCTKTVSLSVRCWLLMTHTYESTVNVVAHVAVS